MQRSLVWFTDVMAEPGRASGVRALARAQMSTEILDAAREQLAEHGAGALSLRAVARQVGMAASAIYRYFDSRDALLTALITDAYNSLAEAVESAEGSVPREDLLGRWRSVALTVRIWALDNPHLYALVYGSPVPGYAAPQNTVGPATRVTRVLSGIVIDFVQGGGVAHDQASRPMPARAEEGIAPLRDFLGAPVPADLAMRALMAWTGIFGAVSFELFGQLHDAVEPDLRADVYAVEVDQMATWLGLADD